MFRCAVVVAGGVAVRFVAGITKYADMLSWRMRNCPIAGGFVAKVNKPYCKADTIVGGENQVFRIIYKQRVSGALIRAFYTGRLACGMSHTVLTAADPILATLIVFQMPRSPAVTSLLELHIQMSPKGEGVNAVDGLPDCENAVTITIGRANQQIRERGQR